jgi:histidinol-phosphate aminotransferase
MKKPDEEEGDRMIRLREEILEIPAYKQGAIPASDAVKLSSNENPYPPLPSVREAVLGRIDEINRYPAMTAPELVARIARHHGVDEDTIALGSGSVEVAGQLICATSGPGDEVLFAWPSFTAYPTLARIAGATPVMVPLTDDDRHDLPAMAKAITERTRLILVCNPNNPTGTTVSAREFEEFLALVPEDVLVVLDEAYVHFNRREDAIRGLDSFREHPNVALLYTFSKAYGLAGLRVGYAVAQPEIADALRRVAVPFGVTDLAQSAAIASLDAEDELATRLDEIVSERERVIAGLRSAGCELVDSDANFVWLRSGARTAEVNETLRRHGVLARGSGNDGMRITIGTASENDRVLNAAAEIAAVMAS